MKKGAKVVPATPLKLSVAAKYRFFLGGDNFTGEGRYIFFLLGNL